MVNLYSNNKPMLKWLFKNLHSSVKYHPFQSINKPNKKSWISNLTLYQPEEKINSLKNIEDSNKKNYH